MSYGEHVHINVDLIKHETDSAFLVVIDNEELWLPFSQVADYESYSKGDRDLTLSITEWIARERGLI